MLWKKAIVLHIQFSNAFLQWKEGYNFRWMSLKLQYVSIGLNTGMAPI